MAKKKGKKTGEQAGPPSPDLMNELFGQLLSLDPALVPGSEPEAPPAPVEAQAIEEIPAESERVLQTEDTLVVLAAHMDEGQAKPERVAAAGEPEPESLLAMVENTAPVQLSPALDEPPAPPELGVDIVLGSEPAPPGDLSGWEPPAVETTTVDAAAAELPIAAEAAPPVTIPEDSEALIDAVLSEANEPKPVATEPSEPQSVAAEAVEELPPTLEEIVEDQATLSASRILKPQQQAGDAIEAGVLDALIGAIDGEIARTPLQLAGTRSDDGEESGPGETCAVFSLGGATYGVPVGNILEIDQAGEVTPVPNVPDFVRGVINLRGEIMCVLDLAAFVGQPPLPEDHTGWLLVVKGGRKMQTAALLVDDVKNLVRVPESQLRPPAGTINDKVSSLLRGTLERNDRILRVLSLDSLFESGDLQQLRM